MFSVLASPFSFCSRLLPHLFPCCYSSSSLSSKYIRLPRSEFEVHRKQEDFTESELIFVPVEESFRFNQQEINKHKETSLQADSSSSSSFPSTRHAAVFSASLAAHYNSAVRHREELLKAAEELDKEEKTNKKPESAINSFSSGFDSPPDFSDPELNESIEQFYSGRLQTNHSEQDEEENQQEIEQEIERVLEAAAQMTQKNNLSTGLYNEIDTFTEFNHRGSITQSGDFHHSMDELDGI